MFGIKGYVFDKDNTKYLVNVPPNPSINSLIDAQIVLNTMIEERKDLNLTYYFVCLISEKECCK